MAKKEITMRIFLALAILLFISCGKVKKTENNEMQLNTSFIEVSIGGMTCTNCEQKIQQSIAALDGIKSVKASHTAANAVVEYLPDLVDTIKIRNAISETGYTVKEFLPAPAQ